MIGLSPFSTDNNYTSITYGLYLSASDKLEVYESGKRKATSSVALSIGDRVSVERVGSTVYYKHNDVVFYTSTRSSVSESLVVDVSLYSTGATLSNPRLIGLTPPVNNPPVSQPQSVQVVQGQTITITLGATDAEGDALIYS